MLNTNLAVENEPVKKKQRFANLETRELDVLLESAQSQNTKYNTSFAVSVYKGKFAKKCSNHYKKMLGLSTEISIKFCEIYGKFKLYLFSEWTQHKNVEKTLHEQSDQELDNNLRAFYGEARNKEGKEYEKSALLCLRSGIERYLNFPPYNRDLKFSQNPAFKNSNTMLNAKIKDLKQQGKQNVEHKPDFLLKTYKS